LAELVLDLALSNHSSLLGKRYLDPACGSGIFLVTLFNRMAEEWKQANPTARNDRRARELREILCNNLFGIDTNPTACRITAFSLYLAYLDQLSPRDVLELAAKGHKLPKLVHYPELQKDNPVEGHIWCSDFFDTDAPYPTAVDLVVGNPPWGSTAHKNTPAGRWCNDPTRRLPVPDKQIAAAFIWKAAEHVDTKGRVCLIVPHSTLFNHTRTSTAFQKRLFSLNTVEQVLNLADYRFFSICRSSPSRSCNLLPQ
jgi:type I restriction-modification system DNA methylase subunit